MNEPVSWWPWWLGALALGLAAVVHHYWAQRPLGPGGTLARVLDFRARRAAERQDSAFTDEQGLRSALRSATLEEMRKSGMEVPAALLETSVPVANSPGSLNSYFGSPIGAQAVFVIMMVAGAAAARAARGGWSLQLKPDELLVRFFGGGWQIGAVLLLGGMFVGFGAQWMAGCPLGHGVSGCARIQRGSLLSFPLFLGVAVVTSLIFNRVSAQ